jgi:hypothetical protein
MRCLMDRSVSVEFSLLGYDAIVVGTEELAPFILGLVWFVVFCVTAHAALCPTRKTSLQRCKNLTYHLKSFFP